MHGKTIWDRVQKDDERPRTICALKRLIRRLGAGGNHPIIIATVEPVMDPETHKTHAQPMVIQFRFGDSPDSDMVVQALLANLEEAKVLQRKERAVPGLDTNLDEAK